MWFQRKPRVVTHFQTRHSESAVRVNSQAVMNVALDADRNVAQLWFHEHHLELYPNDAVKVLKDLLEQIGDAIDHLEAEIPK
jgi:hypothetical protein